MSMRMRIAFGCHFLVVLLLIVFGFAYLFRADFMPYHSVAVGMSWAEVPSQFRILILALMKGLGAVSLALAFALCVLLFVPFRHGATWALWAVPLLNLFQSATLAYAMSHVALNTPATPPFWAPAATVVLSILALVVSISGRERSATMQHGVSAEVHRSV